MTLQSVPRAGIAFLVTAAAFGAGFAAWGAVEDDDGHENSSADVREVARPVVPINNLERAPTIKPLRSVAGEAPPEGSSP